MAKTLREEDLRLNIIVGGDKARKQILDLEKSVKDTTASVKSMRKEQEMLAKQGQTDSARYRELTKSIKEGNASIADQKKSLSDLRGQLSVSSMTIAELTQRQRSLKKALDETQPGTEQWKQLSDELKTTSSRLVELKSQTGSTGTALSGLSGTLTKTIAGVTAAFVAVRKFSGWMGSVARTITSFEQANANLSTILGKSVESMGALTNEALRLGRSTQYTASEVTGLETELAKLGFSDNQILAMTEPVLNFATAVGASLPEAASLAGATLRMFGLQASDTEDAVAALALSTNRSALDFGFLQNAMSTVGPVAKTFGFSLKDTIALLGTLANAGFDASSAATATRNILLNLADSSGKLAQALGQPAHTLPQLLDALQQLNAQGVDLATTLELTDKRSVAAFNSFLAGAEDTLTLRDSIEETGGVLSDIAEKRMDTVEGAVKTLKSAWEGLILTFSSVKGAAKGVVDALTAGVGVLTKIAAAAVEYSKTVAALAVGLVNLITWQKTKEIWDNREIALAKLKAFWSKANRVAIDEEVAAMQREVAAGASVRASTALLTAAKALLTGNIKAAATAMGLFNKALLANPIGLVIGAVSAGAAAFTAFSKAIKASGDAAKSVKEIHRLSSSGIVETTAAIKKERDELNSLAALVSSSEKGSRLRADAIQTLNDKYGEYLPHLLSEASGNDEVAQAVEAVNLALERRIRLQARDKATSEVQTKVLQQQQAAANDIIDIVENRTGKALSSAGILQITDFVNSIEGKNQYAAIYELRKLIADLGVTKGISNSQSRKLDNVVKDLKKVQTEATKASAIINGIYGTDSPASTSTKAGSSESTPADRGSSDTTPPRTGSGAKKWSLESDESYLTAKAELIRKYNDKEIATKEEFDEQLYQLEVSTLTARIAANKEKGADLEALNVQLQEKIQKHEEARLSKEKKLSEEGAKLLSEEAKQTDATLEQKIAAEDKRYEEEKTKFQGHEDVLEAIEKKHQRNLAKIRLDAQTKQFNNDKAAYELKRKNLENRYDELIAKERKGSGKEIALQREKATELAAIDLKYFNNLLKQYQKIIDSGEVGGIKLDDEQIAAYKKLLADLQKQVNSTEDSVKELGLKFWKGTGGGSLFGVSQSQWELLFTNLKNGKLTAEDLVNTLSAVGGIATESFEIASLAIQKTTAEENNALKAYQKANEKKKSDLEKRLDAGLISQAQYDAQTQRMEAEQDAYEEELALKQAKRQKMMNILQATINTAVSVVKTLAEFGATPAGLVAAGVAAAMGAAQIAIMAATPVTTGAEEGGIVLTDKDGKMVVTRRQDGKKFPARLSPDKRGLITQPTVLVGENGSEYVIPHEALENPSLKPFIDTIETARQQGRLRELRLETVRPDIVVTGRASGGYTGETAAASQSGATMAGPANGLTGSESRELLALLRKMSDTFDKPINATVAMLGHGGIVETTEEYNKLKARGKL